MNPDVLSEVDCCRLCGFVFRDKRRKRNVVGEFAKMFEKVVGVEVLEGDKQAVCDTCRYRVEKSWKSGKSIQDPFLHLFLLMIAASTREPADSNL